MATRAEIEQYQEALTKLGYNLGEPDGIIGPKTRGAVREFQRASGLPVTGKLDSASLNALMHDSVEHSMSVPDIRQAQEMLNKAGFNAGEVDGDIGELTRGAVRRAEEAYGLQADGIIDEKLIDALKNPPAAAADVATPASPAEAVGGPEVALSVPEIRDLQTKLNKAGYEMPVDGSIGDITRGGVKEVEAALGLPADGKVDQAFLDTFQGKIAEVKLTVSEQQEYLQTLGYEPGIADNKDGPNTQAARRAFQEDMGVPATGQFNYAEMEALAKAYAAKIAPQAPAAEIAEAPAQEESVAVTPPQRPISHTPETAYAAEQTVAQNPPQRPISRTPRNIEVPEPSMRLPDELPPELRVAQTPPQPIQMPEPSMRLPDELPPELRVAQKPSQPIQMPEPSMRLPDELPSELRVAQNPPQRPISPTPRTFDQADLQMRAPEEQPAELRAAEQPTPASPTPPMTNSYAAVEPSNVPPKIGAAAAVDALANASPIMRQRPGKPIDTEIAVPTYQWAVPNENPALPQLSREQQQYALSRLGYAPGALSAGDTPQATDALRKFQENAGLEATGTLDNATTFELSKAFNALPQVTPESFNFVEYKPGKVKALREGVENPNNAVLADYLIQKNLLAPEAKPENPNDFTPAMHVATLRLQSAMGVEIIDGVIGTNGRKAIMEDLAKPLGEQIVADAPITLPTATAEYKGEPMRIRDKDTGEMRKLNASEREYIARMGHAEAGYQTALGLQGTIENFVSRVNSSHYPDDIPGVMEQKTGKTYAYSPMYYGTVPDYNDIPEARRAETDRIIDGLEAGTIPPITNGGTFFINPKATDSARNKREHANNGPIIKIEQHTFAGNDALIDLRNRLRNEGVGNPAEHPEFIALQQRQAKEAETNYRLAYDQRYGEGAYDLQFGEAAKQPDQLIALGDIPTPGQMLAQELTPMPQATQEELRVASLGNEAFAAAAAAEVKETLPQFNLSEATRRAMQDTLDVGGIRQRPSKEDATMYVQGLGPDTFIPGHQDNTPERVAVYLVSPDGKVDRYEGRTGGYYEGAMDGTQPGEDMLPNSELAGTYDVQQNAFVFNMSNETANKAGVGQGYRSPVDGSFSFARVVSDPKQTSRGVSWENVGEKGAKAFHPDGINYRSKRDEIMKEIKSGERTTGDGNRGCISFDHEQSQAFFGRLAELRAQGAYPQNLMVVPHASEMRIVTDAELSPEQRGQIVVEPPAPAIAVAAATPDVDMTELAARAGVLHPGIALSEEPAPTENPTKKAAEITLGGLTFKAQAEEVTPENDPTINSEVGASGTPKEAAAREQAAARPRA